MHNCTKAINPHTADFFLNSVYLDSLTKRLSQMKQMKKAMRFIHLLQNIRVYLTDIRRES